MRLLKRGPTALVRAMTNPRRPLHLDALMAAGAAAALPALTMNTSAATGVRSRRVWGWAGGASQAGASHPSRVWNNGDAPESGKGHGPDAPGDRKETT